MIRSRYSRKVGLAHDTVSHKTDHCAYYHHYAIDGRGRPMLQGLQIQL